MNGGQEKFFAEGSEGAADANWIWPNTVYEFRLYAGKERTRLLDTITVTQSEGALLAAGLDLTEATVPGTARISWSTGDGSWGQVYTTLKHINFYYPANSAAAIAQLETLRNRGAEFLLLAKTSFWWLDHYKEFEQYLDTHCRRIWRDDHCIIYKLSESEPYSVETA